MATPFWPLIQYAFNGNKASIPVVIRLFSLNGKIPAQTEKFNSLYKDDFCLPFSLSGLCDLVNLIKTKALGYVSKMYML